MSSKRLVSKLVTFECNATILKDAMNIGTDNILFLPHNNHMMITNDVSSFSCFKLMNKECFLEYKLETPILDEWYKKRNVVNLQPVVFEQKGLITLLEKIKTRVRITIEAPVPGEIRWIHVDDLAGSGTKFSGKVQLMEKEFMADRLLSRFVEFFDSESVMIPKPSFSANGDFHIFKIKEDAVFSPIVVKDDFKQFIISIACINPDEYSIEVFNTSLEGVYQSNYVFDFVQSTNEDKLQKYDTHSNSFFTFPANPVVMERVIKFQSGQISHIVVIEENNPDIPFFVFFCSLKDMGDGGKVYTSSLLYLEGKNREVRPNVEIQGDV